MCYFSSWTPFQSSLIVTIAVKTCVRPWTTVAWLSVIVMIYLYGNLLSVLTVWYTPAVITIWNLTYLSLCIACTYCQIRASLFLFKRPRIYFLLLSHSMPPWLYWLCAFSFLWLHPMSNGHLIVTGEEEGWGLVAALLLKMIFPSCHVIYKTRILGEKHLTPYIWDVTVSNLHLLHVRMCKN